MIRIVRPRLPSELESSLATLTQELADTPATARDEHAQQLWKRKTVRRNVYIPLRAALEDMAPGVACCMYCGNQLADNIDHFIPKAKSPIRTFCWHNLLLSCATCNSRFKGEKHKGDGLFGSLLIDPTREDPFDYLALALDSGVYREVDGSKKGLWTIEVCGLNHKGLPRARSKAWRQLGGNLRSWDRARADHDQAEMHYYVCCMRDQPFADVCHAALRHAVSEHAESIFAYSHPSVLELLRDEELRASLLA
ncbi:HNH endonuclease [Streptomyces sioyaensis]|uniref:HNH endonuclease n=1 Tax=Streptomyces sioyaensis TaxID=67364 RepID=UPI0037D94508